MISNVLFPIIEKTKNRMSSLMGSTQLFIEKEIIYE
jgi:hypothetical protein